MSERERPGKEKPQEQPTPQPARPDLFAFLEKLFDGAGQRPELIELRQAFGPGGRRYSESPIGVPKEFKPNAEKPSREKLVALSNELLDGAQSDCNEIGKPHGYAVLAKHYARGDSYYAKFYIKLKPKHRFVSDGEDESEDDITDAQRRDALLAYSLDHLKTGDEHERWRQDQFSGALGDIVEKYQNLVQILMAQNMEFMKEHRELFRTADEALSKKAERDLASEMQKFKMSMLQDGFQFLRQMAPVAVNQLTGKETIPTKDSAESIAVKTFLEGLTDVQAEALFGKYNETKTALLPTGVFTTEQAVIFANVANGNLPPSALDQLLEGEHAVTPDQIAKAQGVVSPQQFMPLVALVMGRQKKQLPPESQQTA